MSNYSKTVDFEAKDALSTGDPAKIIKGTEIDDEFDAIAVASATKYDSGDVATAAEARAQTTNAKLITPGRIASIFTDQNTFSPSTYTGWSVDPDWTFNYVLVGNIVFVYEKGSATLVADSNTTGASLTGWPAAIRPTTASVQTSCFPIVDESAGNERTGYFRISNAGAVTIFILKQDANNRLSSTGFNTGSDKGLVKNCFFSYTIDA